MSDLQRCPFCGSASAYVSAWGLKKVVACDDCGARGPSSLSPERAIRYWDERVIPPVRLDEQARKNLCDRFSETARRDGTT